MILRSVGIAGAIVVGLAVVAALTLLPAVLTILGPAPGPVRRPPGRRAPGTDGAWARLARRVMRHPVAVLVPTLGFLLLLGSPFLHVRFNAPDASILPAEVPVARGIRPAPARSSARASSRRSHSPSERRARRRRRPTWPRLYDYSRRLAPIHA